MITTGTLVQNKDRTAVTIANAAELVANIVQDISGNEISNTLNKATITRELVVNMSCRRITNNLLNRINK